MHRRTWGLVLLGWGALGTVGSLACIEPPAILRRDGGMDGATAPPPLAVTAVRIEALDGTAWPMESAPRRPRVNVETSRDLDDDAPVYLLRGESDDALLDDLASSPLRSENTMRIVPCDVHRELGRVELVPDVPLTPGERFTVAVPSWARSGRDALGEPYVALLTVSAAPEAGAVATASWPPDGASDVGTTLGRVVVRFDGPLATFDGAIELRRGDVTVARRVSAMDCASIGLSGWCAALDDLPPLMPLAEHTLLLTDARDATGASLPPWSAGFTTGVGSDTVAPTLGFLACAPDEDELTQGCALVGDDRIVLRVAASEASVVSLRSGIARAVALAPRGTASLALFRLSPETEHSLAIEVTDVSGLRTTDALVVTTRSPLPRLIITEARVDPVGREPTQEYVELWNAGTVPIDLRRMTLADGLDREGDLLSDAVLSPGGRILVVSDGFDPDDGSDAPGIPPGARLLRIGTSLGDAGLGNGGEPIVLRDESGARLSMLAPLVVREAGWCVHRVGDDPLAAGADDVREGPCSPASVSAP